MTTSSKSSNGVKATDVAAKTAPISQNSEKAAKLLDKSKPAAPAAAKAAKAPAAPKADKAAKAPEAAKPTKKSIVMSMTSDPKGATLDEIVAKIVADGIDADAEKTKRTCRLWLVKLPYKVVRKDGRYYKA
jgi:hypothetical protein